MTDAAARRADVRSRIVDLAARLLREEGPGALTTRGVAERAGVQAPMIYRLFGDKDGLIEAVAEHVMAGFAAAKATEPAKATEAARAATAPLDDLRTAWHRQIDFGVRNPALFRLLSDPDRVRESPAARSGRQVLRDRIHRIAAAGRLRVSEQHAAGLLEAAAVGAIQVLLATPPDQRDPGLATGMYEAVLTRILTAVPEQTANALGQTANAPEPGADSSEPVADARRPGTDAREPAADGTVTAAVTLRALAPDLAALTPSERQLLADWLDRIIKVNSPERTP